MRVLVPAIAGCVAGASVAAAVTAAWGDARWEREMRRVRADALRADSVEAARDTTRAVLVAGAGAGVGVGAGAGAVLADSERAVRRRIVQVAQRADSLDRALGAERAARLRVEAGVAALEASATGRADTARVAEFVVAEAPYHVWARVELPPAPAEGRMEVRVRLDTAGVEARIACQVGGAAGAAAAAAAAAAAGAAGVRGAELVLKGPAWLTLRIGAVEQEARVCSPEPAAVAAGRRGLVARLAARVQVGVGYALVAAPGGGVVRGPALAVTWRLAGP